MKKLWTKSMAWVLTLAMTISMLPTAVFATVEDADTQQGGYTGADDTTVVASGTQAWTFDDFDKLDAGTMCLADQVAFMTWVEETYPTNAIGAAPTDNTIGSATNPFQIGHAALLVELAELVATDATYGVNSAYSYKNANYELCNHIDMSGVGQIDMTGFAGTLKAKPGDTNYICYHFKDTNHGDETYHGVFTDTSTGTISNILATPVSAAGLWDGETATQPTGGNITSAAELAYLATNTEDALSGDYTLTIDIDLADYAWTPIGEYTTPLPFEGSFNGGNHDILSLNVKGEGKLGLFGAAENATIQNINVFGKVIGNDNNAEYLGGIVGFNSADGDTATVKNCTFTGTVENGNFVGGIVGMNQAWGSDANSIANVTNCSAIATVKGADNIGGVVGQNKAAGAAATATVEYCTHDGEVFGISTSKSQGVGGVVGWNTAINNTETAIAKVEHCKNTGAVTVTNAESYYIGGVVGLNVAEKGTVTVSDCENAGAVASTKKTNQVGGVVGCNSAQKGTATVESCKNTGKVTAETDFENTSGDSVNGSIGGVVGRNLSREAYAATVTDCENTADVHGSAKVGGVVGLCDVLLSTGSSVVQNCVATCDTVTASEDATNVGRVVGGEAIHEGTGTITLSGNTANADMTIGEKGSAITVTDGTETDKNGADIGDGTAGGTTPTDDLWTSYAASGLAVAGEISSAEELAYFAKAVNDSTITGGTYTLTRNINLTGHEWVAIGTSRGKFTGTFDGGGHTVSGLYINQPDSIYQGLFGFVSDATIKNLNVVGDVTGEYHVGGVVGYHRAYDASSSVTNCSFAGSVTGTSFTIGGVVGYNYALSGHTASVRNCYNSGTVYGTSTVGGVVGMSQASKNNSTVTVTNCYNTGAVSSSGGSVGGVVGNNFPSSGTAQVSNCYNTGAVAGSNTYVGGVVGHNSDDSIISNCYNTGSVTGVNDVGGLVGYGSSGSSVSNCYNTGNVTGTNRIGGVVGWNNGGSALNCVSLANTITGDSDVGRVMTISVHAGDGLYAWSGTKAGNATFVLSEATKTTTGLDGADLFYSSSTGFSGEGFSWDTICPSSDWTAPGGTIKSQLPKLTDVSDNYPQNPLANLSFVTVHFDVDSDGIVDDDETVIKGEGSVTMTEGDIPEGTWGAVDTSTGEITTVAVGTVYTEDATIIKAAACVEVFRGSATYYDTIEHAMTAGIKMVVDDNGIDADDVSVKLEKDATVESTLEITQGIKLELNGYTLSASADTFPVVTVNSADAVTIQTGGNITSGQYGVLVESGECCLYDASTTIYDNKDYGVYIKNGGTFTMHNGSIGNSDDGGNGNGVYIADGASFAMHDGSVNYNTSYGVYIAEGAFFAMNGGYVTSNEGYDVYAADTFYPKTDAIINTVYLEAGEFINLIQGYNSYDIAPEITTETKPTKDASVKVVQLPSGDTAISQIESAEGYHVSKTETNSVIFSARASITKDNVTTGYATVDKAIEAAVAGDEIDLLMDIETNKTATISKAVILDLNGFDISRTGSGNALAVNENLTLQDSEGGGSITGGSVHLANGKTVILASAYTGDEIDITTTTAPTATNPVTVIVADGDYNSGKLTADDVSGFSYSGTADKVLLADKIQLVVWTYTADGATLEAHSDSDTATGDGGTVTLSATGGDYTGNAYEATATETRWLAGSYSIDYYSGDSKLDDAPSAVGTYTAKITLGSATASVDFTIDYAVATGDVSDYVTVGDWYAGDGTETLEAVGEYTISTDPDDFTKGVTLPIAADSGNKTITVYAKDTNDVIVKLTVSYNVDIVTPVLSVTAPTASGTSLDYTLDNTATEQISGTTYTVSPTDGAKIANGTLTISKAGTYTVTATSGAGKKDSETITVYGVTFDGGTAQLVKAGGTVTSQTATDKTGYEFDKWMNGSSAFVFTTPINANTALTSAWTLKDTTITLADFTATYNGVAQTITPSIDHDLTAGIGYTYQWYKKGTSDYEVIDGATSATYDVTNVSDSGDYKLKVTATVGTDTSTAEQAFTVTIQPKTITSDMITMPTATYTYTGDEQKPEPTISFTNGANGTTTLTTSDYSLSYSNNENAGDATVTVTAAVNGNYADDTTKANGSFTIGKKELTLTGAAIETKVYDGTTDGTQDAIRYSGNISEETPVLTGTFTWSSANAGTTGFGVSNIALTADAVNANYTLPSTTLPNQTGTAAITQATLNIAAKTMTYNGTTSYVVEDLDGVIVDGTAETVDATYTTTSKDVGTYIANVALSDDNYQTGTLGDLTVEAKEVGLTWSDNDAQNVTDFSFVYDGSAVSVTTTATGLITVNGVTDPCTVTVTDGGMVDAGTYDAAVTALSNGNYKLPSTGLTQSYTITKAPVSFVVTANTHTYDKTAKEATLTQNTGEAALNPSDYQVTYGETADSIPFAATQTNANVYEIQVELKNDNFKFDGQLDTVRTLVLTDETLSIHPKTITGAWTATSAVYDGTEHSPTMTSFTGIITGDAVPTVTYVYTQDGVTATAKHAGSYLATATLSDTNYILTNPTAKFTINKAPVTFTVTNNTVPHDGTTQGATVNADASASYTVSYKNSNGESVENPADVDTYDVYVTINDTNYRHATTANGGALKVGVLTIYKTAPTTYTVTFNDGTTELSGIAGTVHTLPSGADTGAEKFSGWSYNKAIHKAGDLFTQPNRNVTMEAVYQALYQITGTVDQDNGDDTTTALNDTVVTLMSGSKQIAQTTTRTIGGVVGSYQFATVPAGTYNIVVTYDGVTRTSMVTIADSNVAIPTITMPKGVTNSIVEVKPGTPDVVVGKLDTLFDDTSADSTTADDFTSADKAVVDANGSVELNMTVEEVTATVTESTKTAIETATKGDVALFVDIDIEKIVTEVGQPPVTSPVTETSNLLEIILPIPSHLQNKASYAIYREHGSDIHEITTTPVGGEYIVLNEAMTEIVLHVKKFSTYALVYTERNSGGIFSYSSSVAKTENGSAALSGTKNWLNSTVTITPTPDAGYQLGTITVTSNSGRDVTVTNNGDGTYSYKQPGSSTTVTVTFKKSAANVFPFIDVDTDDWFYESVKFAYENGLMKGTTDTTFAPMLGTTRGMIITILHRLEGTPEASVTNEFDDVADGMYYTDAVAWGDEHGIILGYGNGNFGPDDNITREQLAAILYRYAQYKDMDVSMGENTNILSYNDAFDISEYAIPAMQWTCGAGIITGKNAGMLDPAGLATRCEVSMMLMRFMELRT